MGSPLLDEPFLDRPRQSVQMSTTCPLDGFEWLRARHSEAYFGKSLGAFLFRPFQGGSPCRLCILLCPLAKFDQLAGFPLGGGLVGVSADISLVFLSHAGFSIGPRERSLTRCLGPRILRRSPGRRCFLPLGNDKSCRQAKTKEAEDNLLHALFRSRAALPAKATPPFCS